MFRIISCWTRASEVVKSRLTFRRFLCCRRLPRNIFRLTSSISLSFNDFFVVVVVVVAKINGQESWFSSWRNITTLHHVMERRRFLMVTLKGLWDWIFKTLAMFKREAWKKLGLDDHELIRELLSFEVFFMHRNKPAAASQTSLASYVNKNVYLLNSDVLCSIQPQPIVIEIENNFSLLYFLQANLLRCENLNVNFSSQERFPPL